MVGEVFDSVADNYDLMNDLMSFGAHRAWKRFAAGQSGLHSGCAALDVAAGSGDLAKLLARQVGSDGMLVVGDINGAMLTAGRDKLTDAGLPNNRAGDVAFALCAAEKLCFKDNFFHCATIAFGFRNFTCKEDALASLYRVIRPGGRLLILEFSKPLNPLVGKIYNAYSSAIIPKLGKRVAGDENSYRYLVESIRRHPDQNTVTAMMQTAGFEDVRVHNLSGGIVALHIGFKY